MNQPNLNAFADALRAEAVIPADAPAPPEEAHDRPWFIALLQGFAGWLGGIFLVIFIGIVLKPETFSGFLVLGLALLLAAWTIYQVARNLVFLDQLALAISIAGQISVAASVLQDQFSGRLLSATVLALQVGVFVVMPNRAARTLAALFATLAWVYTIRFLLQPAFSGQELFGSVHGSDTALLGAWTAPTGWLLTWIPLLAGTVWLLGREAQWMAGAARDYARPALTGTLLAMAIGGIATEPFATLFLEFSHVGQAISWWTLFPLLSIALAVFAGYGAFQVRSAGLLGFAILAVLAHLSRFYYLFGTTLLWKSLIMLVVGAALVGASIWLQRRDAVAGGA
jgi:hypothetical protein